MLTQWPRVSGSNQQLVRVNLRFIINLFKGTTFDPKDGSILHVELARSNSRQKRNSEGIPSIGISPLSSGWTKSQRNVASADIATVATSIDYGFIPVLHGDAVLVHSLGCTILSGDVIIRHLADSLRPEYVVFIVIKSLTLLVRVGILIFPMMMQTRLIKSDVKKTDLDDLQLQKMLVKWVIISGVAL